MEFNKKVILKNGTECILRNATESDAQETLDVFKLTHIETDFMLSYTDEKEPDIAEERDFLESQRKSERSLMLCAVVDGKIVGTCGFSPIGKFEKTAHRAEFGIGIVKSHWNMGIGGLMLEACIGCAKTCGYMQVELDVVADNASALSLYKKAGFVEYGRNPRGFKSRYTGWQELVLMRREL